MTTPGMTRRQALRRIWASGLALGLPLPLAACRSDELDPPDEMAAPAFEEGAPPESALSTEDTERLLSWTRILRSEGFDDPARPFGLAAARAGELAIGTPYEGFTLEEYIRAGGSPIRTEPLTLSLTRFDCISLVESCLAIARLARQSETPSWNAFGLEMERMRYRGGVRAGYTSRLHYFSEWLADNERRGLLRQLGQELGAVEDRRPLRFMSNNPDAYPAMAHPDVREEIAATERALDDQPRRVVPTARIPEISDRLETGDILGFATSIGGLDVTHAAFAYRDPGGVLRILHAPLSGGVVEITTSTVPQYVAAIRQATGILVARPLQG